MTRPLAAAALLLAPVIAAGQGPYVGPGVPPGPSFAPGFGGPHGAPGPYLAPGFGPQPFGPPGFGGPGAFGGPAFPPPGFRASPGFGPAGTPRLAAPALPEPAGAFAPGPSQSTLYRPSPLAPPVILEPVEKEVTVGRVTARRYDYSFEAVPLPGAFGGEPGPVW